RNVRSLIHLGALLLIIEIGIFALMATLGLPMSGGVAGEKAVTVPEYVEMLRGKEWILLLGFLLMVTLKGATWFAPQLIALHGMTTMHALRWSVYAAIGNIGAMLVYGLVLLGIFLAALIPWALGLMVVFPVMVISTYIGYREVFEAPSGSD